MSRRAAHQVQLASTPSWIDARVRASFIAFVARSSGGPYNRHPSE